MTATGACSSTEEPAVQATAPPLTAVTPLDPSAVVATRPPSTTTTIDTNSSMTSSSLSARPDVARFIPILDLADGIVTLDLEFVDGTRASISWSSQLDLTSRGIVPYGWAFIAGGAARDFFIRPGPVADVLDRLGGAELLDEYLDDNGSAVGLWRPESDQVDYLGFQFDNWTVLVYDYRADNLKMSEEHRSLWATHFQGEQTEEGFLRLSTEPPLELVYAGDYPAPLNMIMRGEGGEVKLIPGACSPGNIAQSADNDGMSAWCSDSGKLVVEAFGSEEFQQAVFTNLTVKSVEIGVPPSTEEDQ